MRFLDLFYENLTISVEQQKPLLTYVTLTKNSENYNVLFEGSVDPILKSVGLSKEEIQSFNIENQNLKYAFTILRGRNQINGNYKNDDKDKKKMSNKEMLAHIRLDMIINAHMKKFDLKVESPTYNAIKKAFSDENLSIQAKSDAVYQELANHVHVEVLKINSQMQNALKCLGYTPQQFCKIGFLMQDIKDATDDEKAKAAKALIDFASTLPQNNAKQLAFKGSLFALGAMGCVSSVIITSLMAAGVMAVPFAIPAILAAFVLPSLITGAAVSGVLAVGFGVLSGKSFFKAHTVANYTVGERELLDGTQNKIKEFAAAPA